MGGERRGSGQERKTRKRQIQSIVKGRMNLMEKERDGEEERREREADRERGTSLGVQWLRLCTPTAESYNFDPRLGD